MQGIRNLAPQRFRPHPFIRKHLEDINELARGLADLHERYIDWREKSGMLRDSLGETFSGQNSGANFVYDWTQSSDVAVVGEQLQPGVKASARFEEQGEVAGKDRDVFCARPIKEADRGAPSGSFAFFGDRFYRDE